MGLGSATVPFASDATSVSPSPDGRVRAEAKVAVVEDEVIRHGSREPPSPS